MIARLSRSADFQRLSRGGRRIRSGPMTLIALPDPDLDEARVAFAVRRDAGTAVRRNRIRRRIRSVCQRLDAQGTIEPGLYLIAPQGAMADLAASDVVAYVEGAFERVRPR